MFNVLKQKVEKGGYANFFVNYESSRMILFYNINQILNIYQ